MLAEIGQHALQRHLVFLRDESSTLSVRPDHILIVQIKLDAADIFAQRALRDRHANRI